jgi:hypothetical protein
MPAFVSRVCGYLVAFAFAHGGILPWPGPVVSTKNRAALAFWTGPFLSLKKQERRVGCARPPPIPHRYPQETASPPLRRIAPTF